MVFFLYCCDKENKNIFIGKNNQYWLCKRFQMMINLCVFLYRFNLMETLRKLICKTKRQIGLKWKNVRQLMSNLSCIISRAKLSSRNRVAVNFYLGGTNTFFAQNVRARDKRASNMNFEKKILQDFKSFISRRLQFNTLWHLVSPKSFSVCNCDVNAIATKHFIDRIEIASHQ